MGRTVVQAATHTDTNLPGDVKMDVALLIDVYHHGGWFVAVVVEGEREEGEVRLYCACHLRSATLSCPRTLTPPRQPTVEKPVTYMRKLRAQMAPGGRLVVIDFHRDPKRIWSHPPEWVLEHVRAGQDVFTSEIEQAGFVLEREVAIETMRENYMLVFRNPSS